MSIYRPTWEIFTIRLATITITQTRGVYETSNIVMLIMTDRCNQFRKCLNMRRCVRTLRTLDVIVNVCVWVNMYRCVHDMYTCAYAFGYAEI